MNFTIKVFTPAGLVFQDSTSSVSLPTANGEIGILSQHTSYTGLLGTGILEYTSAEGAKSRRLVISGGFCRFSGDTLVILADSVDLPEELDKTSYSKGREELQKTVDTGDATSQEWILARDRLTRIEALDKLLS